MSEKSGTVEINDLIFKELIKRGYSLDGNTRIWDVSDSKLWYLRPEQAQAYLDLLDSGYYKENFSDKEADLIKSTLKNTVEIVGTSPLNIVDIGCGDGKKAIQFIKEISKKTKVRYCPVDISGYMVQKALENIRGVNEAEEVVEFQWNISDFDNLENISSILRQNEYKRNFFLLLGGTLGNFDFHELMYQIRSAMKTNDYLLIGNSLKTDSVEKKLEDYAKANGSYHNWLVRVPLQLGFKEEDLEKNRRIRNQRVEVYYTIKKDHVIKFGGKEVKFFKGDQIIVAVSYRYPKDEFRGFLNLYFDEVNIKFSKDGTHALALCKK